MNISINTRTQYLPYSSITRQAYRQEPLFGGAAQGNILSGTGVFRSAFSELTEGSTTERIQKSRQARELARQSEIIPQKKRFSRGGESADGEDGENGENVENGFPAKTGSYTPSKHTGMSADRVNGYMQLSETSGNEKEEETKKPVNYNYKEVASKIQRAKTSMSAGRAVLAAKRKVLELKGRISAGNGDPEELQSALTHAKRMEMAARKKKHHLELEELAATVQKRDEQFDKAEEAVSGMRDALIQAEEENVSEKEDAILEEREDMICEAAEELKESRSQDSEELLSELNAMISEFGEEELKELEEAMEMLENLEFIDPHMSPEELEELKRKHRAAENKAIMKADMDYLKDMIKHQLAKAGSIPGIGSGGKAGLGLAVGSVSGSGLGPGSIYGTEASASHSLSSGMALSAGAVSFSGGGAVDVSL